MRKFAMFSTAMLGLAFVTPTHAQPANSAPQPGLPPGAAIGAPNAQQPRATGDLRTTTTGVQPVPSAPPAVVAAPPSRRVIHHHRARIRHHHVTHPAPAATTTPAPQ